MPSDMSGASTDAKMSSCSFDRRVRSIEISANLDEPMRVVVEGPPEALSRLLSIAKNTASLAGDAKFLDENPIDDPGAEDFELATEQQIQRGAEALRRAIKGCVAPARYESFARAVLEARDG